MPETVYLAPGDEVASIKAKLDRATGNPIILIAPKSAKALRDPLIAKLLKRRAEFLAKDVLLVSPDRVARQLATFHGLPAYSSLTQVRGWRPKAKSQGSSDRIPASPYIQHSSFGMAGLGISILAFLLVVLLVSAGYLVLPAATVTLFSAAQTLSETIPITATTDAKGIDYQSGIIPARVIEASTELTDQADIAGKKPTPDAAATGQVTFMNKVGTKVVVPKGTLISTKTGIKFRTGAEATLAPSQWSSTRVGIIADQAGKAGNVDKLAIDQVLDPQLSAQVSVVNENPTQGGSDKDVGAVTIEDRSHLETQALAKAKNEVFQKLQTTKKPSESIYPQTVNVQIVDEQFDRKVGDETKTLSVKLVVKGTGLAFEAHDVNDVMGKFINSKLPEGLELSSEGVKIKPLGADKWTDSLVAFHAQADAKAITALDEDKVKREIVGKSKEEAQQYLMDTLVLANRPDVKMEAGWFGAVPRFTWRIKINLRTP